MKLVTSIDFKIQLKTSTDYYKNINSNLGNRFKSEVKKGLINIKKSNYYEIRYNNIHCYPLEVFPFMIHYSIESDFIFILEIIHTSRNPKDSWINY